jgi:hypothetical protein
MASAANEKPSPRKLFESVWVRVALVVAVVEGILVAVDVIPRWVAVVIAAVVIVAYFLRGRSVTQPSVRQGLWAAAMSQAIVLFVPIIGWIVGAAVIVVLAVVAALVVVALVLDR